MQDQVLPIQINRANSVWWDDIKTPNKTENRQEIITNSFKSSFEFLENQLGNNVDDWFWKRVISVEHEHAIGKAGGLLRTFFNVGPFETVGGNEVINNQIFKLDSTGIYKITAGPSTRRVIDFSDIENSLAILPTGQSGNVFSDHYKDQAQFGFGDRIYSSFRLVRNCISIANNLLHPFLLIIHDFLSFFNGNISIIHQGLVYK